MKIKRCVEQRRRARSAWHLCGYVLTMLLSSLFATAQEIEIKTLELPIDPKVGDNFRFFPLGERGVLIMLQSERIERGEVELSFALLDADFRRRWERTFPVKYGTIVADYALDGDQLFLLASPKELNYEILQLDLVEGTMRRIEFENLKGYLITKFEVANDLIFLGGNIKTYPAVVAYDYKNNRKIILSSVNQLRAELVDVEVDAENEVISVVLFQESPPIQRGLYINRYDFQGKLIANFFYPTEADLRLLSYRAIILSPLETLFLGTFALRGSDQAHGLYAMKVSYNEVVFFKQYHFPEMKNFLTYMPENKRVRTAAKVAQRKSRGKPLFFQYHTFLQDLVFDGEQVIVSLDVYEPSYDRSNAASLVTYTEGRSFVGYGSRNDPSLERIVRSSYNFKGFQPSLMPKERLNPGKMFPTNFQYITTISCGFDAQGALLWDNAFVYDEAVNHHFPLHFTRTAPLPNNELLMARVFLSQQLEETFQYKRTAQASYTDSTKTLLFMDNKVVDRALLSALDTTNSRADRAEGIKSYEYGGFTHWYGRHFLATGLKEVRESSFAGARRDVYFIRKISYLPK